MILFDRARDRGEKIRLELVADRREGAGVVRMSERERQLHRVREAFSREGVVPVRVDRLVGVPLVTDRLG